MSAAAIPEPMSYSLPPASQLHELPVDQQKETLGHLFEPCETLSTFIIETVLSRRVASYHELIESTRSELIKFLSTDEENPAVAKIIAAHPRLGPAKNQTLSLHSTSEQKSLAGTKEESQQLLNLNEEYERVFPGLRYVVFVNGRSRQEIMRNMRERIDAGDISAERRYAFDAMCDIAHDRSKKLEAKF